MTPEGRGQRLCYGLFGFVAGLAWVYWSCYSNPGNVPEWIVAGWHTVGWSLSLMALGLLSIGSRRTSDMSQQAREMLFNIGVLMLIIGLIGFQLGLGMVLVQCAKYLLKWEGWAVSAMIGWVVTIYSLVYVSNVLREGD